MNRFEKALKMKLSETNVISPPLSGNIERQFLDVVMNTKIKKTNSHNMVLAVIASCFCILAIVVMLRVQLLNRPENSPFANQPTQIESISPTPPQVEAASPTPIPSTTINEDSTAKSPHDAIVILSAIPDGSTRTQNFELSLGTELTVNALSKDETTTLTDDNGESFISRSYSMSPISFGVIADEIESITYSSDGYGQFTRFDFLWREGLMKAAEDQGISYSEISLKANKIESASGTYCEAYGVVGDKEFYCDLYMITDNKVTASITDMEMFDMLMETDYSQNQQELLEKVYFVGWSAIDELQDELEELDGNSHKTPDFSMLPKATVSIEVAFHDGTKNVYKIDISFSKEGRLIAFLRDSMV